MHVRIRKVQTLMYFEWHKINHLWQKKLCFYCKSLKNSVSLGVCSHSPSVSQVHSLQVNPVLVQHHGLVFRVPNGQVSWL